MAPTPWRDDVQQAYIRVMTDEGDYLIYPQMGATLSSLWGLPNSPETGTMGENLIKGALDREGRFIGKSVEANAVPTGYQRIRFDVFMTSGSRDEILLSIEQDLGLI